MLRSGSLRLASGRMVMGPKAERRFGRRNFMDLYAVFSSPQSYTVCTAAGQVLGTLSQGFVDRLVEGVSSFLLAGRAWAVTQVRHSDRQVRVEPAPRGRQPTWGSFLPQFLGFRVCQQIRHILCSDQVYPYLEPQAATALAEKRAAFAGVLAPGSDGAGGGAGDGAENRAGKGAGDGDGNRAGKGAGDGAGNRAGKGAGDGAENRAGKGAGDIEVDVGEIRWWTFAGGRINFTLRHALEALGTWKVVADNHAVRVRGEGLDQGAFREAVARLCELEVWDDESLWQTVLANLPSYRLSKFQPLMPPWVEREMLADHLLDVEGAWRWVSGNLDGVIAESLGRVPEALRQAAARIPAPARAFAGPAGDVLPLPAVQTRRPVRWIDSDEALCEVCRALAEEPVIGLDVETSLASRALCLVQLAGARFIAVIDALAVSDFSKLAALLGNAGVTKVIHNASFERSVLGAHEIAIENAFDTLAVSRRLRGRDTPDGHGLAAVCARELGLMLDKTAQTSDWTRRPLSAGQLAYAALDAEVLLDLYEIFQKTLRQGALI
jgi:ATP-dependent helicase Lhr and Lhr-like helicase